MLFFLGRRGQEGRRIGGLCARSCACACAGFFYPTFSAQNLSQEVAGHVCVCDKTHSCVCHDVWRASMLCSVLQCVVVCCRMLQCVAVCCNVLWHDV